jgi:hypothetical protein
MHLDAGREGDKQLIINQSCLYLHSLGSQFPAIATCCNVHLVSIIDKPGLRGNAMPAPAASADCSRVDGRASEILEINSCYMKRYDELQSNLVDRKLSYMKTVAALLCFA